MVNFNYVVFLNGGRQANKSIPFTSTPMYINTNTMNPPNIILIGFRGTGKTTISMQLAEVLGLQRVSTDQRVMERLGMSIASFVEQFGWAEFRRIEHEEIQALRTMLQGKDRKSVV